MKVFIGADHRGFKLKQEIHDLLTRSGHKVIDMGSYDEESCDYPLISCKVASSVVKSKNARGILVCMTGIGHSIAANKVPGALAALCYNKEAAILSRQHNNSNVLSLGADFITFEQVTEAIDLWLATEFEGGRHQRRIDKISKLEHSL